MIRCTQIMLGFVLLVTANHASAQLGPQWAGTWKSEDGHSIKRVTASRIDETFDPLGKKDMPEAHEGTLHWTNEPEEKAGPEIEGVFGYAKKPLSQRDISRRYEEALRSYRKDPTDFNVSDPVKSRHAINAIAPGIYKVMWSYGGGDCGFEEHVVDGDKMLVVSECKYGFGVRLFKRVR